MARGALHFGAVNSDRAEISNSSTIGDASQFTVLAIPRFTGTLAANLGLFGGTGVTGGASTIQVRTNGTGGNVQFQVLGSTAFNYVTNDTPFSGTGWLYFAATCDFGVAGHIYTGAVGNPKSIAERAYGTSTNGATKTTSSNQQNNTWGNRYAAGFASAWRGDIALGAVFAGVVMTLAEIVQWFQRPGVHIKTYTASHFGRAGKDGADWIAYAGTSGTITGATQSNGVGFNQGSDLWQQQTVGSPLYTVST